MGARVEIARERDWRATRVERLRLLATRPEGLSGEQADELEYNDGVRFGLDLALAALQRERVAPSLPRRCAAHDRYHDCPAEPARSTG
jgi:hypothetical protein